MQQMNIRLETIHERPLKTELGMYHYLIECSSCSYETYQKLTEGSRFNFRYLGSFPVR
jgi:prephenate dehydratase